MLDRSDRHSVTLVSCLSLILVIGGVALLPYPAGAWRLRNCRNGRAVHSRLIGTTRDVEAHSPATAITRVLLDELVVHRGLAAPAPSGPRSVQPQDASGTLSPTFGIALNGEVLPLPPDEHAPGDRSFTPHSGRSPPLS